MTTAANEKACTFLISNQWDPRPRVEFPGPEAKLPEK
jgi:hypothetical protein